jgi:preprotein translocase subunit SecG
VLVLVVLIQKGRGGGLSGAFGGGMGSSLLGSKTGDFLTWVTIGLVVIFLTLAVVMAKYLKPSVSDFGPATVAGQTQPASSAQQTDAPQAPAPEMPAGMDQTTEVPQSPPIIDINTLPPEG